LSTSTPPEFLRWLDGELKERGWSDNQLAKSAKINSGTVSRIRSGTSPGWDVCAAIANAFKINPEIVMRMVGLLPKPIDYNPKVEEMLWKFSEMGEDDQNEMLHIARMKADRIRGKRPMVEFAPGVFGDRRNPNRSDPSIGRRTTDKGNGCD